MNETRIEDPRTDARFEETGCLLCGAHDGFRTWCTLDADVAGVAYRHALVRCRCGFIFVRPRLKPDFFREYYRDYHARHDVSTWADSKRDYDARIARRVLRVLTEHGLPREGSVLEVGSGPGTFVEEAARLGYRARGLEPSSDAVAYARARGLDVIEGYLEDASVSETFDAVVLIQTLEHFPRPLAALSRVRELVRPGGLVGIEVPNVDNVFTVWSKRFGMGHRSCTLHPGDHYSYFSAASLEDAIRRAGLAVVETQAGFHVELLERRLPRVLARTAARVSHALRWGMSLFTVARRP